MLQTASCGRGINMLDTEKKPEVMETDMSVSGLPLFSSVDTEEKSGSEKKKSAWAVIMALIVITLLLMLMIQAGVTLNESTIQLSALKSEIRTLEKQNREYRSLLDKKNDNVVFEQYATEELGMLKGQDNEESEQKDKIE